MSAYVELLGAAILDNFKQHLIYGLWPPLASQNRATSERRLCSRNVGVIVPSSQVFRDLPQKIRPEKAPLWGQEHLAQFVSRQELPVPNPIIKNLDQARSVSFWSLQVLIGAVLTFLDMICSRVCRSPCMLSNFCCFQVWDFQHCERETCQEPWVDIALHLVPMDPTFYAGCVLKLTVLFLWLF